jgi:segregation and condensation protein B
MTDIEKEQELMKKVEASLFLSARFLSMPELVSFTGINPITLAGLMAKLQQKYSSQDNALAIIEKNQLYKMDVRPEFSSLINKLATGSTEFTKAEQATLAIISYKQPIRQSVVVKIRGNKAYEHVKKFMELGLIKTKKVAHTMELSLNDSFYDYFSLGKRDEIDIKPEEISSN